MTRYDVAVIGAGLGGLSAALVLAARGQRVVLMERAEDIGGKAGVVRLDGVDVDTGPSLFTLPEALRTVFGEAGLCLEDEVELLRHSPVFEHRFPDGVRFCTHHTLDGTLASVRDALGAGPEAELARFVARARRIWEASSPFFVWSGAPSFSSFSRAPARAFRSLLDLDAGRSLADAIDDDVRNPYLRSLLLRYATYNGSHPARIPGTLACIAWVELGLGAFGVRGGMYAIADALRRACVARGVELRLSTEVTRIVVERGTVAGVETCDGRVLASTVVMNGEASMVPRLLGRAERAESAEPSTSGWNAIVRARRNPVRTPHTVFYPERYEEEFVDLFERARIPRDPTVYVCAQEKAHGRTGWPEHEALFLMVNAPPVSSRSVDHGGVAHARERALSRLRAEGLIEPGDAIVWERTPHQLAERFPGSQGSLYGAASHGMLAAFKRPANRDRSVRGLYLASGTAHPGGGVPLALMSGVHAARALIDDGAVAPPRAVRAPRLG